MPVKRKATTPDGRTKLARELAKHTAAVERMVVAYVINDRLNASQAMLAREIGEQRVNALIVDFTAAMAANPELVHMLYSQPDPYRWLHEQQQEWRTKVH